MSTQPLRFTPAKRDRFLDLIGQGKTIGFACADVGVSRTTIEKWRVRGEAGKDPDAADFAGRYAEARELARAHGQAPLEAGFTPLHRVRFLTLLEAGKTIGEACADVGISRTTVNRWDLDGRHGRRPEAVEFHERFAALRDGSTGAGELSQADLIRLLERQAKKGSVQATKLLLERPWERGDDGRDNEPDDPFAALEAAGAAGAQRPPLRRIA